MMTLLVRNEADIVEANLDYHLAQGVDAVIVTDHGSRDGTRELLHPYEHAGVLTVIEEDGDEHHQSQRVTRMARLAHAQHGADWVIHNDADEFWWPLSGSLRDVFASIPAAYGQIEVQRRNFLPRRESGGPFYSRLVYRDAQSLNPSGRPLEPKVAHRAHPDVIVAPGNHWISGAELRPVPATSLLEIFHYPMRSYEQFERKVIQVGTGYEKLAYRSPEVGRDQLKLLQVYRDNGLREYYEDAVLDEGVLRRRVEEGSVVLDRRLEHFMDSLPERVAHRNRPDGPASRSFVSWSLNASLHLESSRNALEQAHAELDRANEDRAQARDEAAMLREQAVSLRAELAHANETLRAIRGSRLLRWTAPFRRVWYRVR